MIAEKQTSSRLKKLKHLGQMSLLRSLYWFVPHVEWVQFHLGNAYAEQGQPEKAIPLWRMTCSHTSTPRPAALYNLGTVLLQLNRPEEAIAPLQKLTTITNQAHAFALLGSAYRRTKQIPKAIAAYEESLSRQPSNDVIRFTMAVLLEQTRQIERALANYSQITDPSLHAQAKARCQRLER